MRFIELTHAKSGKPMSINPECIQGVMTADIIPSNEWADSSARTIILVGGVNYHIREMPAEVRKLILWPKADELPGTGGEPAKHEGDK